MSDFACKRIKKIFYKTLIDKKMSLPSDSSCRGLIMASVCAARLVFERDEALFGQICLLARELGLIVIDFRKTCISV